MFKTIRGNTAERVISALEVDVVVINSEYKS
jgi:nucleotide-binding universal stress UspA family protein